MNWNKLESKDTLVKVIEESKERPILIFKHSTRCSISSMALNRLERSWNQDEVGELKPYYLDLIAHRDVSNAIAEKLGIFHQSPQVIILKDGSPVYDNSHMGIDYNSLKKEI